MKRRLQLTIAAALCTGLLASGCMVDVADEDYVDASDDIGYAQDDLDAKLESDEGETEEGGVEGRIAMPPSPSSVHIPDDQAFEALFEPQPQPWDGDEGMDGGKGDQSGK